jgi:hypothetical protein
VLFVVANGVPPNGLAPVTHTYLELSEGKEVEYVRGLESVVMYTEVLVTYQSVPLSETQM